MVAIQIWLLKVLEHCSVLLLHVLLEANVVSRLLSTIVPLPRLLIRLFTRCPTHTLQTQLFVCLVVGTIFLVGQHAQMCFYVRCGRIYTRHGEMHACRSIEQACK